jgi:hypothetical protein
MEFYPAIRKKKILLFAGKWMEMENIMLSKVKGRMFSLMWKCGN